MPAKLSVNLNKIALLRNSRDTRIPDIVAAAETCIEAGAQGITVHPRPDLRHIRPEDVYRLAEFLAQPRYHHIEFNIEGNPDAGPEANGYPGFMTLVKSVRPHQCTLVPDDPGQLTSDHGFDLQKDLAVDDNLLSGHIAALKTLGIRVSLFMDPDTEQIKRAPDSGTDRIELYTGPYADTFGTPEGDAVFTQFLDAAEVAADLGLGLNAGHDLNLDNLPRFCQTRNLLEVSIGHALIKDALWMGLASAVSAYRAILDQHS